MKIYAVAIFITLAVEVLSYKCRHSCEKFFKHHTCPPLDDSSCEIVRMDCGCCDECALVRGAKCSSHKPRCASGLMCMNEKGEALHVVPRFLRSFVGVCERVTVRPIVVENTDVKERRIRI